MIIELLKTQPMDSQKQWRYFLDGKRVSEKKYNETVSAFKRLDCFRTVKDKGFWRHYACAMTN